MRRTPIALVFHAAALNDSGKMKMPAGEVHGGAHRRKPER